DGEPTSAETSPEEQPPRPAQRLLLRPPGAGEGPEIGMLSPPWRKPWQRSSLPDRHSASYRVPPPGAGEGWAWGEDRRGAFLWGYPDPSQPFRSLRKRFGCSGNRSGRSGNVLDAPE